MSTPEPSGARWIVVPKWDEFQHYAYRRPTWIKVYTRLLDDPAYRGLSFFHRALLHGIWLLYAASNRDVPASPAYLSSRLGLPTEAEARVTRQSPPSRHPVAIESPDSQQDTGDRPVRLRDLKRLEQAGFITLSASKPLAPASKPLEQSKSKRRTPLPPTGKEPEPQQPELINGQARPGIWQCPLCQPIQRVDFTSTRKLEEHIEHIHNKPYGEARAYLATQGITVT